MKTRIVLLLGLTLASIQAPAQSVYTPYSWSTIGGTYQLDFLAGYVFGTWGYADGNGPNALFDGVGAWRWTTRETCIWPTLETR
jgi:hypothetical protein